MLEKLFGYFERSPLNRFAIWLGMACGLLIALAFFAPQQLPVVLYKLVLVVIAIVIAYLLDRLVFPYARPHKLMQEAEKADCIESQDYRLIACLCMWRRALIILACVLGLTLGL